MSVFLLDTTDLLPLPSIRAYAAVSTLLLSCSIYYAIQVTSEPDWKSNSNLNLTLFSDALFGFDVNKMDSNFKEKLTQTVSRLALEQQQDETIQILSVILDKPTVRRIVDVIYLMFHEPLCIWTIIYMALCYLMLVGKLIQRLVFGELRVSERQNLKNLFWNFIFIKSIIVFFVMNVHIMEEIVLWCSWFSLQAFLSMLTQLCKDRFEYLSISPTISKWAHTKLITLLIIIIVQSLSMCVISCLLNYYIGLSVFIFMVNDCLLTLVRTTHLLIRYAIYFSDLNPNSSWEQSSLTYYTDFIFELLIISINFVYYFHIIFWSTVLISLTNTAIVVQLKSLICKFDRRIKKHKNYLQVVRLMEKNFPMASKEELNENNSDCPICWENMTTGRKLPCGHLFHNFCLRSWLEQDTSCPTCRKSLRNHQTIDSSRDTNSPNNYVMRNRLYRFDGSRYANWLPSIAVQVIRSVNSNSINSETNVFAGSNTLGSNVAPNSSSNSITISATIAERSNETSNPTSSSTELLNNRPNDLIET